MNILFIHASNIVESATSGIIRVTATLKRIFEEHGHKCYNAYYKEVDGKGRSVFDESLKLTSVDDAKQLVEACLRWSIDAVICQMHPTEVTNRLFEALHQSPQLSVRPMIIECMHNNPYIETLGYTPGYLWYLLNDMKIAMPMRMKKVLWGLFCCYMPNTARRNVARRYQKAFDLTDKVVMLSDKFVPEMQKFQHYKDGQLTFANNPMTYECALGSLNLDTKEKLVVFVGRLEEAQKRLSASLEIWKKIEKDSRFDDWRFDIVGRGEDEAYYKQLAKKLNLRRVTFCGEQNPKEWYRKASILMLTSAYEGWGMVINEAQQLGVVPVAYGSYASIRDLITDGVDGCIVPNLDEDAFVNTMKRLMTDEDMRNSMQTEGMKNSGRYSEDYIYSQWEKILYSNKLA